MFGHHCALISEMYSERCVTTKHTNATAHCPQPLPARCFAASFVKQGGVILPCKRSTRRPTCLGERYHVLQSERAAPARSGWCICIREPASHNRSLQQTVASRTALPEKVFTLVLYSEDSVGFFEPRKFMVCMVSLLYRCHQIAPKGTSESIS